MESPRIFNQLFMKPTQSIPVYTVLKILIKMKQQLGLEVMLDYMDYYLKIIETHNPDIKEAVEKALTMINVEKIYKEAKECKGNTDQ